MIAIGMGKACSYGFSLLKRKNIMEIADIKYNLCYNARGS